MYWYSALGQRLKQGYGKVMNGFANRQAAAPTAARQRFPARIIPAVLVVYACMLPRELTFEIVEVAFQPFRVMLTLLIPVAILMLGQQRMRPSFVDFLMIFAAFWAFIALCVTASVNEALVTGLSDGLNLAFAYFIGRASIRTSKDFQLFFVAILPGLLFCSLVLAVESLSHRNLLRPFVANLVGMPGTSEPYSVRLGLMRARGPFPHAILGGVFLGSFLAIAWYMARSTTARILGMLAVAGFFFSVSSTGFLGVIVASGLMIINYLHRVLKLPIFQAVGFAVLFMMLFIEVFSENGVISFIIRRLTFSAGTGRYRMLIWQFGGADALAHPWFGIGQRTYTRPAWMVAASVDAHWLLITLKYGFPHSMSVLVGMIASVFMCLRGAWSPFPLDQRAAYAMGFSLIGIIFMGLSVYLWEGVNVWMTVLTGMAVTFGQQMALARRLNQVAPGRPSFARMRPA
jgi:hypothetical protein